MCTSLFVLSKLEQYKMRTLIVLNTDQKIGVKEVSNTSFTPCKSVIKTSRLISFRNHFRYFRDHAFQ